MNIKGAACTFWHFILSNFNNIQLRWLGTIGSASWAYNTMFDATSRPCRAATEFFTSRYSSGKQCSTITNANNTTAIDWLSIINSTFKVRQNQNHSLISYIYSITHSLVTKNNTRKNQSQFRQFQPKSTSSPFYQTTIKIWTCKQTAHFIFPKICIDIHSMNVALHSISAPTFLKVHTI